MCKLRGRAVTCSTGVCGTMDFLAVLLLSLAVSPVTLLPSQQPSTEGNRRKTIPEINQGLNLQGGDIKQNNKEVQRSAILGDHYRWPNNYIPYVFDESLSMNDKGVILRAFEQMRLKSCLDFLPRSNEEDYVSIESLEGCWSDVGRRGGMQKLSIGKDCAYLATVEHEFLHCLGFNHEQSRYDRDNYVKIISENIILEELHNFKIEPEQVSTTQGTEYDYTSVMQYGQDAFTNGQGHTILTINPRFQNVIGQEYDLSPLDTYELNKLYNCNGPISFLNKCSFENSMCEMTACSIFLYNYSWSMSSGEPGGPFSDHSTQPSMDVPVVSMSNTSSEPSAFMHLSTVYGWQGMSALLVTKEMTPKRDCKVQCLEFFYYHSASETDQLNIWIREYMNDTDMTGTVRHMNQIKGPSTDHWQLHYVSLDASKPFIVEIEGRKGEGQSRGGFSVDDINIIESECPQSIWQIRNFMDALSSTSGQLLYSPLFYSPEGYRYQALLNISTDQISVHVRLVSGFHDDYLNWPCSWRQVSYVLLDQNPDIQQRMSSQDSITIYPEETSGDHALWGKPSEVGTPYTTTNNETVNATMTKAFNIPINVPRLTDREFVKGGDLILLFSMQDISSLQTKDSLPCPTVMKNGDYVAPYQGAEEGLCSKRQIPTSSPTPSQCFDIFCSSANIVHPSVALLLALILLLVN